ncbi:MAG: LacI family DNA-binding transcriptional regulator [Glaciecola sp.]
MATIYEVAERAGVSLSTVSRVLNGKRSVNEELKAKVDKAVLELDYRPSSVARSLANNRSDSVGLLVSELSTPFFGEMMQSVESNLRAANKHVIITVGHNDLAQEKDAVEFLISRNCDALILHAEALSDETLSLINKNKIPLVLVNRLVPGMEDACICLNNEIGGYLSTKHLIDLGHKRIAYIAGPNKKADANDRLAGHKRALKEAGIAFDLKLFYQGDFTEVGGSQGLSHFVESGTEFTALVCANDWMASGAMSRARDLTLKMPEELSIVGFDNVLFAHHVHPKLTTVNNPITEMGEMAAKSVLKRVYKQNVNIRNVFDPELVIRHSTSLPLTKT